MITNTIFSIWLGLVWMMTGLWRIPSFLHFNYFFGPFLLFLLFNYFFMQFLLFNYFFTEIHFFFIRGPKIGDFASKKFPRVLFFSYIVRKLSASFTTFLSFSYFTVWHAEMSLFHSYIFLLFNYFFIMNIPSF